MDLGRRLMSSSADLASHLQPSSPPPRLAKLVLSWDALDMFMFRILMKTYERSLPHARGITKWMGN